jgi:hypothetical protein
MLTATPQDAPVDTSECMADSIEQIELEILRELDRSGRVDIANWVERYPEYRDRILEFWLWAMPVVSNGRQGESGHTAEIDATVAEQSLRDAALAVNLGSQWLQPPLDPELTALEKLGEQLEVARRQPRQSTKAPVPFRKAVVCAWLVSVLEERRGWVSRLALQKSAYILECSLELQIFVDHRRQRLGPYDHNARYRDAEPIAKKKGWLTIAGSRLHASADSRELTRYVSRYVRSENAALGLVSWLSQRSDEELETLATVLWSACEIVRAGGSATTHAVAEVLARTPEWSGKLKRANFSAERVGDALKYLTALRLIPGS